MIHNSSEIIESKIDILSARLHDVGKASLVLVGQNCYASWSNVLVLSNVRALPVIPPGFQTVESVIGIFDSSAVRIKVS